MLIRSSGPIADNIFLFTLGQTCHYLAGSGAELALFDPGATVHLPFLFERLKRLDLRLEDIRSVFITHVHAERAGAAAALKRLNPELKIIGPAPGDPPSSSSDTLVEDDKVLSSFFPNLPESPEIFTNDYSALGKLDLAVKDGDVLPLGGEGEVRVISFPGHSKTSIAYLLQPTNYLIVDEAAGYFGGRGLAAPGGDDDLAQSIASMQRLNNIALAAVCLPNDGVLTGRLIQKHLAETITNTTDLMEQARTALNDGMAPEDVRVAIESAFYVREKGDPVVQYSLRRTCEAVWRQVAHLGTSEAQAK